MSASLERPKLFTLPEEGELNLPNFELSSDKEAEATVLDAVAETDRVNKYLELVPDNNLWRLDFGGSGSVYIKPFIQRALYADKPRESHVLYVVDVSTSGYVMGLSFSVRHSPKSSNEHNFPFEGFTLTKAHFYNQGLGLRRLLVLNEACKQIYGETLSSGEFMDNSVENPAIKIWERLVQKGFAAKTDDGYRFIK